VLGPSQPLVHLPFRGPGKESFLQKAKKVAKRLTSGRWAVGGQNAGVQVKCGWERGLKAFAEFPSAILRLTRLFCERRSSFAIHVRTLERFGVSPYFQGLEAESVKALVEW
jgi:hypothetical protein